MGRQKARITHRQLPLPNELQNLREFPRDPRHLNTLTGTRLRKPKHFQTKLKQRRITLFEMKLPNINFSEISQTLRMTQTFLPNISFQSCQQFVVSQIFHSPFLHPPKRTRPTTPPGEPLTSTQANIGARKYHPSGRQLNDNRPQKAPLSSSKRQHAKNLSSKIQARREHAPAEKRSRSAVIRRRSGTKGSLVPHFLQKLLQPSTPRILKELFRRTLLRHFATIQKQAPVGNGPSKTNLMSNDNHRHPFAGDLL